MKKKFLSRIIVSLICLCLTSNLFGQTSAPKYSNEFLSVGVGARAFAMGNVAVASQKGVESAYWNPASLVDLKKKYELSAMHAEYFAGMAAYDYVGLGIKLDEKSTLALSIIRYGVDDIPNTLELIDKDGNIRYDLVTTFSASDYAFLFSYAKKTKIEGLSIGGNVKLIYRHTGDFASAYGFGIDAAVKYKRGKWQMGALLRDASSTFNAWVFKTDNLEEVFNTTGNEIPTNSTELTLPRLILAVSREFPISDKFSLLAEFDADLTFDGKRNVLVQADPISIDPHMGFEASFKNLIYLRAGVSNFQEETDFDQSTSWTFQPNLGLGINYKNFRLDYALTDIGDQSVAKYSNVFSLSYSFK
ncbi:PorV/PorQ family protein [Labilibaculum sp. DW002]|uniref:PorV/PorQ family protein n=1 Tax=Paralabilibaculum antarcticum TaxID=2912572 RepID=A0ABT5VRZ2_9BACT|nr:PorV/PorQ family protein [Labilibaculum sp. DW002]MDE5418206.1 PorV/PorQ family protein [Labilibaculum sp. DW002]